MWQKTILKLKLYKEGISHEKVLEIDEIKSITKLLSFEATQAKKTYKNVSNEFEIFNFVRDKESYEGENSKLTLLNNALYGYVTAVILHFGLHPSIGFMHGKTRRGGLAFDIADIFKYNLCIRPAFDSQNIPEKELMIGLSNKIRFKKFRILKEMIYVLRYIYVVK